MKIADSRVGEGGYRMKQGSLIKYYGGCSNQEALYSDLLNECYYSIRQMIKKIPNDKLFNRGYSQIRITFSFENIDENKKECKSK